METLRLFIAIPVPAEIKDRLAAVQKQLTKVNPHVRAVAAPGIHLTLKFLGDTPENRIGAIRAAMEQSVRVARGPIRLHCAGTSAFPDLKSPRVLWAGLETEDETLINIQKALDVALGKLGYEREKRRFHPHLTLGRLKAPKMLGALRKVWVDVENTDFGSFTAEALVLYRSELLPAGAKYTSIERIPLPAK